MERRSQSSKSRDIYALNVLKLKLGKTKTEFFSVKGNARLKRIWLEHNLDNEMIFSSWIGQSRSLLRQNVSDYLQAFLIRRSQYLTFSSAEMFSMLKRLNDFRQTGQESLKSEKDKHPYYSMFVRSALEKSYEQREKEEHARVAKSIANGDLPAIPGFEDVVKNPVYKAQQLETRLKKLSKIPMPYNEKDFEKHILPIMTALAISKENLRPKTKSRSTSSRSEESPDTQPDEHPTLISSSGVSSETGASTVSEGDKVVEDDDSDLIQVFSEIDLHTDLNETLSDICEVCGGLTSDEVNKGLVCSCMQDLVWKGKNEQTASAMYKDASKIVQMYRKENMISSKYMEKFETVIWTNKP